MYDFVVKEQIDQLIKHKLISEKNADAAFHILQDECWSDHIAVRWSIDDVIQTGKEMGKRISKNKARNILHSLLHNHDAEYGICWDTIKSMID